MKLKILLPVLKYHIDRSNRSILELCNNSYSLAGSLLLTLCGDSSEIDARVLRRISDNLGVDLTEFLDVPDPKDEVLNAFLEVE